MKDIAKLAEKLSDPEVFKSMNSKKKTQYLQIYYPKVKLSDSIDLLTNMDEVKSIMVFYAFMKN